MKSIPNALLQDKSSHAPELPENGALRTQKVELAQKYLADFDAYTSKAYDTATADAHTLKRLSQHAAHGALQKAQEMGLLFDFPFPALHAGCRTSLAQLSATADVLAVELHAALSASENVDEAFALLKFCALRLLHTEHALFADLLKEAAWHGRGDEHARNDNPMFYGLFELYLQHSGREDELKADGLLISDILTPGEPIERDAAFFARCFEEELIRLYDEKRDRLAVVTRTLPQYARPDISEEELKAEPSLSLVIRHWEREHAPVLATLQAEREALEIWLATPHLELLYWWARDVEEGLSDCACAMPSIALVLDWWKGKGIAGAEITADAIWEELFRVEEES